MRPAGSPGGTQATLGWWLTATALGVVLVVSALVVAGIARHRHDREGPGGPVRRGEIRSGLAWIHLGLAATIVVLVATYGATMSAMAKTARPGEPAAFTLEVTGHQWWWEVRYVDSVPSLGFVTANEVHVPVGRPVRLRLGTADVLHSFWIPELGGKVDLVNGQVNEGWIRADRPGRFQGQCAEYCGLQHSLMRVSVVADPPERWEAWAAAQRAPASMPRDDAARAGAQLFRGTCGTCHTVRGSGALGRVGPDLTHLASRGAIAAGTLPNTPGNLAAWIADPQHVKPGNRMPRLGLEPAELTAVVTYLQQLR